MILFDISPCAPWSDPTTFRLDRGEAANVLRSWRRRSGSCFIEREVNRQGHARYVLYHLRRTYGDLLLSTLMVRSAV